MRNALYNSATLILVPRLGSRGNISWGKTPQFRSQAQPVLGFLRMARKVYVSASCANSMNDILWLSVK